MYTIFMQDDLQERLQYTSVKHNLEEFYNALKLKLPSRRMEVSIFPLIWICIQPYIYIRGYRIVGCHAPIICILVGHINSVLHTLFLKCEKESGYNTNHYIHVYYLGCCKRFENNVDVGEGIIKI